MARIMRCGLLIYAPETALHLSHGTHDGYRARRLRHGHGISGLGTLAYSFIGYLEPFLERTRALAFRSAQGHLLVHRDARHQYRWHPRDNLSFRIRKAEDERTVHLESAS